MCGLVGFIGAVDTDTKPVLSQLLVADQFRGTHSTGIAVMSETGQLPVVFKKALQGADFIQLKTYDNIMPESYGYRSYTGAPSDLSFVLGHNRYATQGGRGDAGAHPFQYGQVTLMHNGTLTSREGLSTPNLAIDSEHIAQEIAHITEKHPQLSDQIPAIESLLSKLQGSFTLVWHDATSNRVYFSRNNERPLAVIQTDQQQWYFASEEKMLEWVLDRNNVSYENSYDIVPGEIYYLNVDSPNTLYIAGRYTPSTKTVWKVKQGWGSRSGTKTSDSIPEAGGHRLGDRIKVILTRWESAAHNRSVGTAYGYSVEYPDVWFKVSNVNEVHLSEDDQINRGICYSVVPRGSYILGEMKQYYCDPGDLEDAVWNNEINVIGGATSACDYCGCSVTEDEVKASEGFGMVLCDEHLGIAVEGVLVG